MARMAGPPSAKRGLQLLSHGIRGLIIEEEVPFRTVGFLLNPTLQVRRRMVFEEIHTNDFSFLTIDVNLMVKLIDKSRCFQNPSSFPSIQSFQKPLLSVPPIKTEA